MRSQFGERKNTALHLAAEDDYSACVKLLLEAGANINARNVDDQTALHVACLSQSVETVDMLIKYGADLTLTYRDGRTAIHASIVKEANLKIAIEIIIFRFRRRFSRTILDTLILDT